jgi:hypothetical protein
MRKSLSLLFSGIFIATSLVALSSTPASAEVTLTTCTDLGSKASSALKATQKSCKPLLAPALWHLQQSEGPAHLGTSYATIRICSSRNPVFTYQYIKKSCPKFQVTTDYWRAITEPSIPIIASSTASGYDGAVFTLSTTIQTTDAPIAYYLVTNIKTGDITKLSLLSNSQLSLSGLNPLTSYTFTIAAVSVDGTSHSSAITQEIRTEAVPVAEPAPAATSAPVLTAPAFTLTSIAETRMVNTAATGFTISSTGGAIASFAISATPAGMSFNTSIGALSGTPTSVAGATTYTVTATNAVGSSTQEFNFTVIIQIISVAAIAGITTPVAGIAPVTTTTAGTGYTGTVSWSGSPATFASATTYTATITLNPTSGYTLSGVGANFFTVAGATPVTHSANTGVITAIFYMIGATGPGGGKIFYVARTSFACGPTRASNCTYLEAAPALWNAGEAEPKLSWAQSTPVDYQSTVVGSSGSPETAIATAIGWGYRNTRAIVLQGNTDTATSAAALADSYTVTVSSVVYDDWFLPSKDELNQMCKWARGNTLASVSTRCSSTGTINSPTHGASAAGFLQDFYWSSNQYSSENGAEIQTFSIGAQTATQKSTAVYLRPVRAF